MKTIDQKDLVVIGAGPGGYVAAIRASQLGLNTCIIEKDKPGGVCLNWGCIPSKNLIKQAGVYAQRTELKEIGVKIDDSGLDYATVQKKSRQVAEKLNKGVEFLLKKNKVTLIQGTGKITGKNSVALEDGTEIHTKHILVATGSRPLEIPGFEADEKQVLSSNGILAMTQLPKSLVILGAGAIGCEFAYIMNAFGVKVTLIEMADHILPFEDKETVSVLEKSFQRKGIVINTGTKALSIKKQAHSVRITTEKEGTTMTVDAEKTLCVFGRRPNTENIGLETLGIKLSKGYVDVGPYNQTNVSGVYAIGDIVNTPLLAHVASKEGEMAVEHMAGKTGKNGLDLNLIPSAIYCEPQIASFGLNEARAKAQNIPYQKVTFPYQGIGKAVAVGHTEGLVKVLYSPDIKEILGAHIVGADATEIIHELLLAKSAELLPEDIADMIHAHPTISEALMETLRSVDGLPIHI